MLPPTSPPKILLVDDVPSNLLVLEALLSELGCPLVKAASGAEALKHLLGDEFALILLDVQMPEMDGFETARLIRERARLAQVPILFVTAIYQDPEHIARGYALGAVDYLLKPLDPAAVTAKVRTFVGLAEHSQRLQAGMRAERQAKVELSGQAAELERQVRERTAELRAADERKDRFLAMLSHELRNPLGAMRNALHVLGDSAQESPAWQRAHAVMQRQIDHQRRLVDDLLDVNRLLHGRIALDQQSLDLCQVIAAAIEEQQAFAQVAGVEIAAAAPPGPLWVRADPLRLSQILSGLIENGVKFSLPGGTVALTVTPEDGRMVVEVRDTGIGISPEDAPHLFEPLYQADVSLDRSRGGIGLGLTLAKHLAELHGGTLTASSAGLGRGAEFRLTLARAEPPLPGSALVEPEPRVRALRILVVEDNVDAAETLRELLQIGGHTVELALTGAAGVEVAARFLPHVVLCDVGLPDMDGYAVAAALKNNPATAPAHLVAVTGYDRLEDLDRSRAAGFALHLVKPLNPRELENVLSRLGDDAGCPAEL